MRDDGCFASFLFFFFFFFFMLVLRFTNGADQPQRSLFRDADERPRIHASSSEVQIYPGRYKTQV